MDIYGKLHPRMLEELQGEILYQALLVQREIGDLGDWGDQMFGPLGEVVSPFRPTYR